MMKRFCDGCQAEIKAGNWGNQRNTPTPFMGTVIDKGGVRLGVQVVTSRVGVAEEGDFCRHCILDALYTLDDRRVDAADAPAAAPIRATA